MNLTLDDCPHILRRAPVIAAIMVLHVLIAGAMVVSRAPPENGPAGRSMQVWFPAEHRPLPRTVTVPAPPSPPAAAPAAPAVRSRSIPVQMAESPVAAVREEAAAADSAPLEETAPATSAAEMIRRARGDIGAIDRALRQEIPKGLVRAPVLTPQKRLERGIALANEMAPPKWYEAPKVTELIDAGGWGKKRYRVITANGTYCLTYNTNRGDAGSDPFKDRPPPPMTNCDPREQPPTTQP